MRVESEKMTIPAEPVSRGHLRQQVAVRLMTAIFRGRFQSGQRLVVQNLASAYQASPTPVREALRELASLGLVVLLPNRGAVVQPFGPAEIREVRRLLEVEGTRCARGRIPEGERSALEAERLELDDLRRDGAGTTRPHALLGARAGSARGRPIRRRGAGTLPRPA